MRYRIPWGDIPIDICIHGKVIQFMPEVEQWLEDHKIKYMSIIGPLIPLKPTVITKCAQFKSEEDFIAFKLRWL